MANPLLDRWSPQELAERGQVFEKEGNLELFPRLLEVVEKDLGVLPDGRRPAEWRRAPVAFRLAFGWADSRRQLPRLIGSVTASIPAVCQRCLEPFAVDLSQELRLLLAAPDSDSPVAESPDFDTWDLEEAMVRPLDIVDEALLMALPLSAMHVDPADCGALARLPAMESDNRNGDNKVRPFADLRSQMRHED
jgi:uncharacterized protein